MQILSLFASLHKQHCSGSATLTGIKNRLKCTALENLFLGGGGGGGLVTHSFNECLLK